MMVFVTINPIELRIVFLIQHELYVLYDVSLKKQFMFYSMNKMFFFLGKKIYIYIYIYHNHYEMLISYKEITNTHKLFYQPLFPCLFLVFLSCVLTRFRFVLFLTKNNWKWTFNVELINEMYIILTINDFIHLKYIVVEMVPSTLQLFPFPWPSPCTLYCTPLLAHFAYHIIHPSGFSKSSWKCTLILSNFSVDMKNK